jgi:hypothetical protein
MLFILTILHQKIAATTLELGVKNDVFCHLENVKNNLKTVGILIWSANCDYIFLVSKN